MRGLWLLALVLLAGCQHVAAPPVGADIRDLRSGEVLTAQQLLTRLAEPERLIIGEQHDNADHHAAQLWLLQSLGEQRAQGSLLLKCSRRFNKRKSMRHASRNPFRQICPRHWPGKRAGTGTFTGRSCALPCRSRIRCWRPISMTAKSARSTAIHLL